MLNPTSPATIGRNGESKNNGAPRPGQRRQPRLPHSVFACPVGVRTDDSRVAWMGELFVRNDHVTYVWNHIYLKKVRDTYEVRRPVRGRRASDCVSPSIAALTWELPCYNPDQMPHRNGLTLSYLDGHAARVPGSMKEHSWWAYHSRDGWEEAEELLAEILGGEASEAVDDAPQEAPPKRQRKAGQLVLS